MEMSGVYRPASAGQKKRSRSFLLFVLIIDVLIITVLLLFVARPDELKGTWDLDHNTVYEFGGHGKGKLQLAQNTYPFKYALKKGTLSVDFEDDALNDAVFTYTVDDGTLTLANENGTQWSLKKVDSK